MKNLNLEKNSMRGITLIALIITIIVLLILVGVSIVTLTGDNGIITRTNEAKTNMAIGEEKEAIILAYNGVMVKNEGSRVTADELKQELNNNGRTDVEDVTGEDTVTVKFKSGRSYTIDNNGKINEVGNEFEVGAQGNYIYAENVYPVEHDLEVSLSSDTIDDFSGITVKRVGQNLLDINSMVKSDATAETGNLRKNNDGTYTISKVGNNRFSNFVNVFIPRGSIIKLSATLVDSSANSIEDNLAVGLFGENDESVFLRIEGISNQIMTEYAVDFDVVQAYLVILSGNEGAYVTFKDLQLAINVDECPQYQEYTEQEVAANTDGTITGLTSSSPTMLLTTNSNDVVINCKYKSTEEKKFYNLTGKKIVNFGDSIFGNYQPTSDVSTFLSNLTGADVYNVSFGGCRMSTHDTNYTPFSMCSLADSIANQNFESQENALKNYSSFPTYFSNTVARLKNIDFNTVDIITIGYGTNDFGGGKMIDNQNNLYDTNTFAGALRYSIETISKAYPNIEIVICTPIYRFWIDDSNNFLYDSNTYEINGKKLTDFVEIEKKIANDYSLTVVDNYYDLNINETNRAKYFPVDDGTHPNREGRKLIAEYIAKKLYEKLG